MAVVGYRIQDGCHNCAHVFERGDYDEGETLYCNHGKDRPRCGSGAMDEGFAWPVGDMSDEAWDNGKGALQMKAWDAWAEAHAVSGAGICPWWEARHV